MSVGDGARGALGPLMADIAGLELTAEDREVLRHPLVGGALLFARNYSDPAQVAALCAEIAALRTPRLLVAVDHEGGRVQRFRVGFTRIPPMGSLGRRHAEDAPAALAEARAHGATIARELGEVGIDLCFAPVLDRDCGVSQVIGDRAFAQDADTIIALGRAFNAGLGDGGMAATGKHFPGHGAVAADSHHELPVDRRTLAELEATCLVPFRALVAEGLPSVMMAHVRYEKVDELPASLSHRWIRNILRRKLGFKGTVFCDDLSMNGAAVAGDLLARAELALAAGCDMLPVCNDRPGLASLLDGLKAAPRPGSQRRLARLYRGTHHAAPAAPTAPAASGQS